MNNTCTDTVQILANALPHLQKYKGKIMVVKYGGNAMTEPDLQIAFAQSVVWLHSVGVLPVVVHGGGPQIESALQKINKKGVFIQGMRVTDAQTMQVVQWVLAGEVQPNLVSLINNQGGKAVGVSGLDGGLIQAKKLQLQDVQIPDLVHDLGFVGHIVSMNVSVIQALHQAGFIPVISPIGGSDDATNTIYNINADVVASRLATELKAEKLLMLTNIRGVLNKQGELLPKLTAETIDTLCQDGTISGGMIPKIEGALNAAKSGVKSVHILDGRVPHAMLLALFSNTEMGTEIVAV